VDFRDRRRVEPTFDEGPNGRETEGGVDYVEFTHLAKESKRNLLAFREEGRERGRERKQETKLTDSG
jgi:hypothetical protein